VGDRRVEIIEKRRTYVREGSLMDGVLIFAMAVEELERGPEHGEAEGDIFDGGTSAIVGFGESPISVRGEVLEFGGVLKSGL